MYVVHEVLFNSKTPNEVYLLKSSVALLLEHSFYTILELYNFKNIVETLVQYQQIKQTNIL